MVVFESPIPSLLKKERGIKLMLALKSHKALLIIDFPMVHEMLKLPGSLSSRGSFFYKMALHSMRATVSYSTNLFLFSRMPFINFMYFGIC